MHIQHIDYLFHCITRTQPSFPGDTDAIPKHQATHIGTYLDMHVQRMSYVTKICWQSGLYVLLEVQSESAFTTQIFSFFIFISNTNSLDLTVLLFHHFSTFPSKPETFTILKSYPAFSPHFVFPFHHNCNMMYK